MKQNVSEALRGFKKGIVLVIMTAGVLSIPQTWYHAQHGRIFYNTTWSLDKGFYWNDFSPQTQYSRHQMVQLNYVEPQWVTDNSWGHEATSKMIKRILGIPGDRILSVPTPGLTDQAIYVCPDNGPTCQLAGERMPTNPAGQKWPDILSAQLKDGLIPADHYYLGADHAQSYDSRYYGLVPESAIFGQIEPLWLFKMPQSFFKHAMYGPEQMPITVQAAAHIFKDNPALIPDKNLVPISIPNPHADQVTGDLDGLK